MKVFETDIFTLTAHENCIVEMRIKNNVVIDTKDLIDSKTCITSYLKDSKAFILVEAEGTFYTTKEAREMVASDEHSTHHGAIAFCSDKLGHKILGELYIKINRPKVPTKYFTKRKEALMWLDNFVKKK